MTRPTANPASRTGNDDEAGPASLGESRLHQMGLGLQYIAAVCGTRADYAVQVADTSYLPGSIEAGAVRIVEAHLGFPDPAEARFLAAVLCPAVDEPRIAGSWVWRGWIVGDSPHTPLSITLSSDPDATLTPQGGTQ